MKRVVWRTKQCLAYLMAIAVVLGTMQIPMDVHAESLGNGNIVITEDTTLTGSHTVDPDDTLVIAEGVTLTVPSDVVLIVNGTLDNQGTLYIEKDSGIAASGTVTGDGAFLLDAITEDMIQTPITLNYTGEDLAEKVKTETVVYADYGATKEIAGVTFTLKPNLDNWTCSVSPEQVVEAGEYTITYRKNGAEVSTKFTVNRGYLDFDGTPAITGTYGQYLSEMEWTVPETVVEGTWSLYCEDEMPSVKARNYPLMFTPDNENYRPAVFYVYPQIAKKKVTAAIDSAEKEYGSENPAFSYTVSGVLEGDSTADWIVSLNTDATKYSDAGIYEINGTIESDNYEVTVIPGTFIINKADTEIILEHDNVVTKVYGDTFTLDHVKNNVNGNMVYEVIEGTDVIAVSKDGTFTTLSVGYAMVSISMPATKNYNASSSQYVTIHVVKGDAPKVMPEAEMLVPYTTNMVSKITLPEGWSWDGNYKEEALLVGQTLKATAKYIAADADCYENIKATVKITRQMCEKGTILKDSVSKAKYKVTKATLTGGTVMYMGSTKAKAKSITIPATITVEGITYKVTAIKASAFAKNTKLTKVIIGKNVTTIGKKAFFGCKNLKTITINTKKLTLKTIGSKAFKGTSAKAVVKVPKNRVKLYRTILKKRGLHKNARVIKK